MRNSTMMNDELLNDDEKFYNDENELLNDEGKFYNQKSRNMMVPKNEFRHHNKLRTIYWFGLPFHSMEKARYTYYMCIGKKEIFCINEQAWK